MIMIINTTCQSLQNM